MALKCTSYKFYDYEHFDFDALGQRIEKESNNLLNALSAVKYTFAKKDSKLTTKGDHGGEFSEHFYHQGKICSLLSKTFEGFNKLWPKLLNGTSTQSEWKAIQEESQYNYSYTYGHYLRNLVTGSSSYGNWKAQEVYSPLIQGQLKHYGLYDIWKKDNDIIKTPEFLKEMDAFDKIFQNIGQNYYSTEHDQYFLLYQALPQVQANMENAYRKILSEVKQIGNPEDVRDYFRKCPYIYREVFPPCDEDDRESGVFFLRQFKSEYSYKLDDLDPFDFYCQMCRYMIPWLKDATENVALIPEFGQYYQPIIDTYNNFMHTFLNFILQYAHELFPLYISETSAQNVYHHLVDLENLPQDLLKQIKAEKLWFEGVPKEVEKRKVEFRANVATNQAVGEVQKYKADYEKELKKYEKAKKQKNESNLSTARRGMKTIYQRLGDLNVPEAAALRETVKATIDEAKIVKADIKCHDFYMRWKDDIINQQTSLQGVIDRHEDILLNTQITIFKNFLGTVRDEIESFDGDVDKLKEYQPLVDILKQSEDMIANASSNAKPADVVNAEVQFVPQVEAYIPSMQMMIAMPPNPMMVPSLLMIKSQIAAPLAQLRPLVDKSDKIKACVEKADAAMGPFDEYIQKCTTATQ